MQHEPSFKNNIKRVISYGLWMVSIAFSIVTSITVVLNQANRTEVWAFILEYIFTFISFLSSYNGL
jgi:uncharacterized membrane protein